MNFKVLVALLIFPALGHAAIFGVDNRRPLTPDSSQHFLAQATAVALLSGNVSQNADGTIDLLTGRVSPVCGNEKFGTDSSLDYACTGFLVAPDLLVTAGHCVYAVNTPNKELRNETGLACKVFSWLFDYEDQAHSKAATKNINPNRVYGCKQIIYATQTEKAPFLDYALIQLDRPALGRTPFKLASVRPGIGSMLSVIGYPFGTPVKIADQGRVTSDNPSRDSFLTSLDAFSGNSGSPVFNGGNQVVGILVGGTPSRDTVTNDKYKCEQLNRCDENGLNCMFPDKDTSVLPGYQGVGTEIQRIEPILKLIRALRH